MGYGQGARSTSGGGGGVGGFGILLFGDLELQKQLEALPKVMQGKVVRPAMRKAAKQVVMPAIKARIHDVSGDLRASLKVKAPKKSFGESGTGVVIRTGTREELHIRADDPYYYPASVEYGHGDVPAHSFLRSGMDATRDVALGIIRAEIAKGIEKQAQLGRRGPKISKA